MTSSIFINAPVEKVWGILLDKLHHPDRYIPGIAEFVCEERAPGEYIRYLYTENDDVVELAIVNEAQRAIEIRLVKHLFLKGELWQRLEAVENGTRLVIEQNRQITLSEFEGLDMQPALDQAAEQIKALAEAE